MVRRSKIVSRVASSSDSTRGVFYRSRPNSPESPLTWSASHDSLTGESVSFSALGPPHLSENNLWEGPSSISELDGTFLSEYNEISSLDCNVSLRTSMFGETPLLAEVHAESVSEEYPYSILLDYESAGLSGPFSARPLSDSDVIIASQTESLYPSDLDSRIRSLMRELDVGRESASMSYTSLNRRSGRPDSNIQSTSMPSMYSQESAALSQHLLRNTIISHQSTEETFTSRIPNSQSSFATMCVGVALDANESGESDSNTISIIETPLEHDSPVQEGGIISQGQLKKAAGSASWSAFDKFLGKKKQMIAESPRSHPHLRDEVTSNLATFNRDRVDLPTQTYEKRRAENDKRPNESPVPRRKQALLRKTRPPTEPAPAMPILGTMLASKSARKGGTNPPLSPQRPSPTRPVISRPYALQKKKVPSTHEERI